MIIDVGPFRAEHLNDAAGLLADAYERQRVATPLLPERDSSYFLDYLRQFGGNVGAAAFVSGRLCGFMVETMRFSWKGQQVAGCSELSHAVGADDPPAVYRMLHRELAGRWVEEGRHLHILGHLAGDEALTRCLYLLGFGAFLAEELRDLSPLECHGGFAVLEDPDPPALVGLQREHRRYYRHSPIFLKKDDTDAGIQSELEDHLSGGDRLLACADGDGIVALFIVGESASEGEGLLLRRSNTAQLKSAFVRPVERRRGIGAALLERSIGWARDQGYDRMFVEHETANIPGSAFWGRYFRPFVHYSMRYVDNTL